MKGLSGNVRLELDGLASYLGRDYEKCLHIGWQKGGNNINNACQDAILKICHFYRCKIGKLIVFSKVIFKYDTNYRSWC